MHGKIIGDIGMNSTWFRNFEYIGNGKKESVGHKKTFKARVQERQEIVKDC